MINGKQYEWSTLTVVAAGRDITGLKGISYEKTKDLIPLYAKGNKVHSIQGGNEAVQGELSVTQSELIGLTTAGGGSIFNLDIDIIVCYGNPSNGDALTTDIIKGVKFTSDSRGMQQGDGFMDVKLPFIALDVTYNA